MSDFGYIHNSPWKTNENLCTRKVLFEKKEKKTTTRKLRAIWTPELAQDIAAFHQIDAEAELTALLSQEIAAEIDKEIVHNILVEFTGWNVETKSVIVEKWKSYTTYRTGTWTQEFANSLHNNQYLIDISP